MGLYLGSSQKLHINFNGSICKITTPSSLPDTSGIKLLSFDNYILKDSNGVYLTTKEVD